MMALANKRAMRAHMLRVARENMNAARVMYRMAREQVAFFNRHIGGGFASMVADSESRMALGEALSECKRAKASLRYEASVCRDILDWKVV